MTTVRYEVVEDAEVYQEFREWVAEHPRMGEIESVIQASGHHVKALYDLFAASDGPDELDAELDGFLKA